MVHIKAIGNGGPPCRPCVAAKRQRAGALARPYIMIALLILQFASVARSENWKFKDDFLPQLVDRIPELLQSQDKSTGKFGKGVWICRDQEAIYPLAAAWRIESSNNP